MIQEKKTVKDAGETRKRILLGVLVVVMIGVFYIQFFSGDDAKPTPPPANVNNASSSQATPPSPTPTPRPLAPGEKPAPIISTPLEFAWIGKNISNDGTGRNIFVYPTPTPEPPPKPLPPQPTPPPPPIQLSSVNPSGVVGKTGGFTMVLYGDKFPEDAQGFLDGRPYDSKFVSKTELRVQIPAEAIRNAGNPGVQVRSRGDASLFSNQLSLNVAEPPPPNYRYIGLIVRKDGMTAMLKNQVEENDVPTVISVKKGDKFGKYNNWRVINISSERVDVEDTNLKIVHTIRFTGES